METSTSSRDSACRRCGGPLPADAPGGNCPTCLLALAAEASAAPEAEGPTPLLFGHYELVEEIARGGMGIVWRARQAGLGREVALKMILAGRVAGTAQVIRFYTEARAAARLDHPGIVPIHDIGEEEGRHYYTMRLMEGGSLAEQLRRGPLAPGEAARMVCALARALHFAHQRGVLHRDVKPSNVLLDAEREPHLADFGLARLAEEDSRISHSGTLIGTPAYMAPEQAAGRSAGVTAAADVYGLGAVLYEALTGLPPFRAETPLGTLRRVLEEEPAFPRNAATRIHPDLEVICLKCLHKAPQKRYGSAAELAGDLERWLTGTPILARPVSAIERLGSWARRKPALAASLGALAALVCLALAITTFLLLRVDRESRARGAALRLEEGQRLAFQSLSVVADNPGQGLLLALEAAEKGPSVSARNALLVALEACRERRRLLGHQGIVRSCAYSRDGRRVITASGDGTARVWDAATGAALCVLRGHEGPVSSAAFKPDGSRAITAGADGTARIWDAASGAELLVLRGHEHAVKGAAFIGDGERALTVGHTVRVWDARAGTVLHRIAGHTDEVTGVHLDPAGERLATASRDQTARVWDLATGAELATFAAQESPILDVRFSGDGRRLAAAAGTVARVWDLASGRELSAMRGHRFEIYCLRWSADGSRLATGSEDFTARLWDAATGAELRAFRHHHRVVMVDLSPDGALLLTASYDRTARVWDVVSGRLVAEMKGHAAGLYHALLSPDGKEVATASDDFTCRLWAVRAREPLVLDASEETGVVSADLAPGGRTIVEALRRSATARVRDLDAERPPRELRGHEAEVTAVRFSPDGARIVTGSADRTARLWQAASGSLQLTLRGHEAMLLGVAFSPDGRRVLTVAGDLTARVWSADDGAETARFPAELPYLHAAFGPDSDLLALTDDTGVTRLARLSTGEVRKRWYETARISSAELGPDGAMLLTTGTTRVQVVTVDGDAPRALLVHPMRAIHAAYSPDRRWIATTAFDFIVRIWDGATYEEQLGIRRPGKVPTLVCFTWDSRRLVVTWVPEGTRDTDPATPEVAIYPIDVHGEALKAGFGELTPDERDHFHVGSAEERRSLREAWKGGHIYGAEQAAGR